MPKGRDDEKVCRRLSTENWPRRYGIVFGASLAFVTVLLVISLVRFNGQVAAIMAGGAA